MDFDMDEDYINLKITVEPRYNDMPREQWN